MRRCPALLVGKDASVRLRALRDLARNLYFSYASLGLKEFVLAVSFRDDTVSIWMVFPGLDADLRGALGAEAERFGVTFIDLSILEEEEAERFRERFVKGAESYRILWRDDIDGLFDQFEEAFSKEPP